MSGISKIQLALLSFTVFISMINFLHAAREQSQGEDAAALRRHMLLATVADAAPPPGKNTCPVPSEKCGAECDRRCSETSHKNDCLMFCNQCCAACLCVPPGTYGNKECCDCYNNWKTKEGGPKCP